MKTYIQFVSENDTITGWQSQACHYIPNVFLASVLLFIGTFVITMGLKHFRTTNFFPSIFRRILADFAVIIAMITMTVLDIWLNVETPKLKVPNTFTPTLTERNWLVHPLGTLQYDNFVCIRTLVVKYQSQSEVSKQGDALCFTFIKNLLKFENLIFLNCYILKVFEKFGKFKKIVAP